ncbi:hypothetical protein [Kineococcus sp. SYSU DK001]|uniref:hypothetical protein n=1 Tax=Kineococcus sp. SYSU DK001 TaxID=3383122 RepID=UPI003D7F0565
MGQQTTFTITRVFHGGAGGVTNLDTAAALEVDLRARADQRGMVVDSVSDALVQPGPGGGWSLMSRTAVAHLRSS